LYEKIKGLNMATTVIAAFNEFMKDTVNLEKAEPPTRVQVATG
jgi:hypothetical protein